MSMILVGFRAVGTPNPLQSIAIPKKRPPLQIGTLAPAFSLPVLWPSLDEAQIELDQFRGHWLMLIFYPRDFSFVCPTELNAFSDAIDAFSHRDCSMLAISVDSISCHRDWLATPREQGGVAGIRIPLASDVTGELCQKYSVWRSETQDANRGLFLIDPEGILRYAGIHDIRLGRRVESTIELLDALQSGEVCQANWKPQSLGLDIEQLLQPNRVFGHYRIESELGRGAFGITFRAYDLLLNRYVVLKVLRKKAERAFDRMVSEGRMAAQVEHPNVCRIYGMEVIDGLQTIVMEYLPGKTLEQELEATRVAGLDLSLAVKLLGALQAAHEKSIVHGDIKPANIVFRSHGDPVIVDFGLASRVRPVLKNQATKPSQPSDHLNALSSANWSETVEYQIADHEDSASLSGSSPRNSDGGITGTIAYMSPEQIRGDEMTTASDVFSLGLVLVELTQGKRADAADTLKEWYEQLHDETYLSSLASGAGVPLGPVIHKMLAIDPSQRPTCKDVLGRLEMS